MKKKKLVNKNDIKRFVLFFTIMLCLIVSMSTYWIYAYHHKYGKTYHEDKLISYRVSDYVNIDGNIIYLINIDDLINKDFVNKQKNILNNGEIIDMTITKGIYKNILSLKVSYIVTKQSINCEEVLILNVDLTSNKIIEDDEILSMIDKGYKDIAMEIFDTHIKLSNNYYGNVIDTVTEKEISAADFNKNSEKYIIRIREKLPDIMEVYINDSDVYYTVKLSDIYDVCYYADNTNKIINNKIGEI